MSTTNLEKDCLSSLWLRSREFAILYTPRQDSEKASMSSGEMYLSTSMSMRSEGISLKRMMKYCPIVNDSTRMGTILEYRLLTRPWDCRTISGNGANARNKPGRYLDPHWYITMLLHELPLYSGTPPEEIIRPALQAHVPLLL